MRALGNVRGACVLRFAVRNTDIPRGGFLKLDLSFAVLMLGGYVLGPAFGELIIAATVALGLFKSSTAGVGELANFITANVFIMPPVILYKFKKGLKTVVISIAVSSALTVAAALLLNRFLLFPLYMGDGARAVFNCKRSLYSCIQRYKMRGEFGYNLAFI